MDFIRMLLSRCAALFAGKKLDADLDDELRAHIDLATEENVRRGIPQQEARTMALRRFGGVAQTREQYRVQRGLPLVEVLAQDLRSGLRQLIKSPGFTVVALATLALGIGATTALFSVIDAVILRPLPFPVADRLVRVESIVAATGHGGVASWPDFVDWRARNHVSDGMAAFRTNDFTLTGAHDPVHLQGAVVSAQMFSLLGAAPALGRGFLPREDIPAGAGGADAVVLSYGLWQREFGADAAVLGQSIQLGGQPFTVVGVMPPAFQFPIQAEPVELWTTIAVDARGGRNAMTAQRGAHYLDVIALLKPGVTVEQAQAELAAIAGALSKEHPENKPRTIRVMPELQLLVGDLRTPLLVMLGAVGCVLLIVCANIANLLLARATGRRKEMAVRIALGASRLRVTCQLLTESLVLGLLGGGLGVGLAFLSFRSLVRIMPAGVPRLSTVGLDAPMLGFAFLVSLGSGILFGLAPALQAAKVSLTESLNKCGRGSGSADKGHSRLRATLAVSEVALAVVLLLSAGLLLKSFVRLTQVDPGFDPHHVLTFQLDASAGIPPAQFPAFFREAVARIGALPGVGSASAAAALPLTGDQMSSSIEIEGQPTPIGSRPAAAFNIVEPHFFRTVGTSLVNGRDFSAQDDASSTPVVIVNQTLARLFFPNQNPIGKHVRPGIGNGYANLAEPPMREIVGVVEDIKQSGPGIEAGPQVYAPLAQSPTDTMFITARTGGDPASLVAAARRQVTAMDKNLPIYHVRTLDQYFADSVAGPRFSSLLLTGFASLAALLACLGVYGVVSCSVVQRTHEIGVRMAMGASSGHVVRSVLLRGMLLALTGVAIGLAGSCGLAHLLSGLLFGVGATDPTTFAGGTLALLGVAALASYIPARRAARVNPMAALRDE
jgi:putative ABC transport system permease protein